MPDSPDTSPTSDAVVKPIRGAFDTQAAPADTPCRENPEAWFPERKQPGDDDGDGDVDPMEAQLQQRQIRRAAGLCDTCFFRINCAVNALESGSDNGIWAGVLVEPTPARLRKAQRRLAEVIATEIIDTESVPYRVGVMLQDRPDLETLIGDAGVRVRVERSKAAAHKLSRHSAARRRRTA